MSTSENRTTEIRKSKGPIKKPCKKYNFRALAAEIYCLVVLMFEFSHDEVAKKKNFVSFFSIMTGNDESGFHSKSVSPLARSTPIEIKVIIYKSRSQLSLFVKLKIFRAGI